MMLSYMFTISEKIRFLESVFGQVSAERNGDVAVWCPECDESKREKQKLVIRLSDDLVHCWKCGFSSASLIPLLKRYHKNKLNEYVERFYRGRDKNTFKTSEDGAPKKACLPNGFKLLIDCPSRNEVEYLCDRGLTLEDAWRFKLGTSPELSDRIVIPSYDDEGSLNYFTARAIKERMFPKYQNSDVEKKTIVFNEQNIDWHEELVLCEGPFDMMKCPDNTVPLLGSELNSGSEFNESFLLFDKIVINSTPVVLALDADMWNTKRVKISKMLMSYGINVKIVDTRGWEDPGSVSKRTVSERIKRAKEFSVSDSLTDRFKSVLSASRLF